MDDTTAVTWGLGSGCVLESDDDEGYFLFGSTRVLNLLDRNEDLEPLISHCV
jgi:hypothetical protein